MRDRFRRTTARSRFRDLGDDTVLLDTCTGPFVPSSMRETPFGKIKQVHPYQWLWEPLLGEPSFELRSMFGTKTVYLRSKLVLCFAARKEPWRGVLVCTEKSQHELLQKDFPELSPHVILPKWLYLPETLDAFEKVAENLVRAAQRGDPRIGVIPPVKKKASLSKLRTK